MWHKPNGSSSKSSGSWNREHINARKDVYVSDDERKLADSSKAVANREAIMKMQTSMNETMRKPFDETAQKLAAHELRKSYENDQES